jgi:uncharacterized membrane protein HdeD (DUF308 family)/uncharacterized membrane protein YjdF
MARQAATTGVWDRRRLIYGDWNWLIRDGLDVLRILFLAGTVVFAIEGNSDTSALTAAFAVLLIARIVNLPRWFDFGLVVAMTLIAYGTALGLYGHWFYYDKVVHSISPIAYAPVLYIALVRLGVVPDPGVAIREHRVPRIAGIFIVTLALGMAVGAGYESVEWTEDKFGILGGHFVKGLWDTETDLLCDTGGSLVGATFITFWALRGWSSRRVTVVPVPGPGATAFEAASERALGRRALSAAERRREWIEKRLSLAAQGVVGIAAGALLLSLPTPSLRTIGIIIGVALLVTVVIGAVELLRAGPQADRAARGAELAATAAIGVLVLLWPTISERALVYAIGILSIVLGAIEAASLSEARNSHERWLGASASVAALVLGIAMLGSGGRGLHLIVNLLGIYFLVIGSLRLARAAEAHRTAPAGDTR